MKFDLKEEPQWFLFLFKAIKNHQKTHSNKIIFSLLLT